MEMLCTLRSLTDTQRQKLLEHPDKLEEFIDDEEDFEDAEGSRFLDLDIGETWHGLQYLMTGTAWEGKAPLDFLVRGGQDVGDIPSDEGTARVFTPDQVKTLSKALGALSEDTLRKRYDPARLQEEDIYPGFWEEPPPDLDPEEELFSFFEELKKFTAAVARRGHGLLVFIG
ncbi:MAG TPA: YfbM family protein [Archangium sp.]|uniref:YfbM family protein n=1 Tax=Archangium sp. TaxID=1872627 RepID=UPI002E303E77|nr:YfbM family protein [Archangium sp.]HEX5749616.1 YfbM family protein [Archangium sp.]